MKTFKQYILEATIVPASTGNPEELPHGFSIRTPQEVTSEPKPKPNLTKPKVKPINKPNFSFNKLLARAKELASK